MILTDMLGTRLPIIQAPIGSAVSPELIAAVGEAGGLGMMAATWHSLDELSRDIAAVRGLTPAPFGVNLILDFPIDPLLDLALGEGVQLISTFWGDPARARERIAAAGAVHIHVVGSVDEALHAAACEVDIVVAQGYEGGGHVRGSVSSMTLVPAVVDAVDIPVVAAGGISDRRGVAAALALGASGVWVGTRFVAAAESRAHEVYQQAIVDAQPEEAVWTTCFDGGWPNAPHRALRNDSLDAHSRAKPHGRDVIATTADGTGIRRYEDTVPLVGMTGDLRELAMYAGQSVGSIDDVRPAGEIVDELANGLPPAP